jgi:hypothetical protein
MANYAYDLDAAAARAAAYARHGAVQASPAVRALLLVSNT